MPCVIMTPIHPRLFLKKTLKEQAEPSGAACSSKPNLPNKKNIKKRKPTKNGVWVMGKAKLLSL